MESIIYWYDVKKSGVVFGAGLLTLLAMTCYPVISVLAYVSLMALTGTIAFRVYKAVLQSMHNTNEGHPFEEYMDIDLTISQNKAEKQFGIAVGHFNFFTDEVRRLFLVEDLLESLKFFLLLWMTSYVGAWFNGMTWMILAYVSLFTLPKFYDDNKESIDRFLDGVRSKWTQINDAIRSAMPTGIAGLTERDK